MNTRLKRNIGLTLLPFAFLFLFEPRITIFDPLPDFIGYILLCSALSNIADINDRVSEAVSGFRKGILISLSRYLAIYFLESIFNESEASIGLLLFAFVFSFFEVIILIPAYKSLFEGLLSLGLHHDGRAIYYKKSKRRIRTDEDTGKDYIEVIEERRNISEKTYIFTVVFLIIRGLMSSLPEFTSLITNKTYEFANLLRLFGIMITLPVGITWVITIMRYFVSIRRDRPFVTELVNLYFASIRERPNLFTARTVFTGMYTLITAFLFSMEFYNNHANIIPSFCFFVCLCVGSIILHKSSKKWIPVFIISVIGIVTALFAQFSAVNLYSDPNFYASAIQKDIEAYYAYNGMLSYSILNGIVFLIAVVLLTFMLWDVFRKHSSYAITNFSAEKRELTKFFIKGSIPLFVLSIISVAGKIYYIIAQPFENSGNPLLDYASVISVVLSILLTLFAIYYLSFLNNNIKYRYRLDI